MEDSLKDFNGAVILVTHDRYFMDQVASQILAFHRRPDGNTTMETFAGYLQWEEWFEEQKEIDLQEIKKEQKKEEKANKGGKISFKEKFEFENMEATIHVLEEKLLMAQTESGKPEVIGKASRIQELYTEIADLEKKIAKLYERWSELESKVQGT